MKKVIKVQQPPELEPMQSPLMQSMDAKGVMMDVLAIDPGTAKMGIAHIKWQTNTSGKTQMATLLELETIAGASHLPGGCQQTAGLLIELFPSCRVVIIEKPSARIYGAMANPQIHRSFWQVIHLMEAFHNMGITTDTVDAFTWMSVPRKGGQQPADDKMKKPWFDKTFKSWDAGSNNHERDAALLGYWWLHVWHLNQKPRWNTGYGA